MLTSRRSIDDGRANQARERDNLFLLEDDFPFDPVMARHLEAACLYGAIIERVACRHGLLPSIIAGLGSRRSGWGLDLSPAGPEGSMDFIPRLHRTPERDQPLPADGAGFSRGLMLLDYDNHELARGRDWRDPEANINAACQMIVDYRRALRRETALRGPGLLRASFAAFNCGLRSVQQAIRDGLDVDHPTTDGDFGRDVLSRASFFQAHGWD